MTPSSGIKKIIVVAIFLLLSGDVSLLFAAQNNLNDSNSSGSLTNQQGVMGFGVPAPPRNQAQGSSNQGPPQQQVAMQQLLQQLAAGQPSNQPPGQGDVPAPTAAPDRPSTPLPEPVSTDVVGDAAFAGVTRATLPMTPDQIQKLRQMFNASQFSASATPGTPPRPTATSQLVNLAPGATPPVIRLAQGFVTSLVFIDSTGAPWAVESYDVGNPTAFNIQWNKSDNILLVQAQSLYTYGNLAVRLKGLVTPVMLTLIPGQRAIDYRVDLRVQGLGPEAKSVPAGDGLPGTSSPLLLNVLDGIPPDGSHSLKLTGGDGQAWALGDRLFLRTSYAILSPGWIATLSSADGTKAYEMLKTPMVLVSDRGRAIQLKIEGF